MTGTPSPMLEMKGITKRFPGVVANDNVDFDVYPGEVHTLLGHKRRDHARFVLLQPFQHVDDNVQMFFGDVEMFIWVRRQGE